MRLVYSAICLFLMVANARPDASKSDWNYTYQVESSGTKSESVHGSLYYKGGELSKKYQEVVTPIGKFIFVTGRGLGSSEEVGWGPMGTRASGTQYFAHTEQDVEQLLLKSPLDMRTDEAAQGESTAIKSRPRNVGADWFYTIKDGLWINPAEVKASDLYMKPPQTQ